MLLHSENQLFSVKATGYRFGNVYFFFKKKTGGFEGWHHFLLKRREMVRRQPEHCWPNGLGFRVACMQEHDCVECWAYPVKPHRRWHTRALKECARPMHHPVGLCQLLGGLSRPLATAPSARAIITPMSTGAGSLDGKHRLSGLRFRV